MIPNLLTATRVLLVAPILICITRGGERSLGIAAVLFGIAVFTDFLDGQAARRLHQESTFGALFDLFADRLLMTPTLLATALTGLFAGTARFLPGSPIPYVVIVVAADITTLAGIYSFVRLRRADPEVPFPSPPLVAKATYPAQGAVVLVALLPLGASLLVTLMVLAASMTVVAFVVYLRKGGYVFTQGLPLLAGRRSTPATRPHDETD